MKTKRGRGYWQKLVRAFERSGLKQRTFCEQHGLALGTFQHWLYKIRREKKAADKVSTALVRVQLPEQMTKDAALEASLPGGVVLRFSPDTDPHYVATLVAEVESARC
jgi:hypothetical protein